MIIRDRILIYLIIISFSMGCGKKSENGKIVAHIGEWPITFEDFLYDFTLYPQYRNNSTLEQARLRQMKYLIDQTFMAIAAKEDGLGQSRTVQERLEYVKNKEMLKELYRREVLRKIPVSDKEAWEEYKRQNMEVKIRHLFSKTRSGARDYYQRLQNGDSFKQIAKETFHDTTLANNGGLMGYVSLTDLDPLLVDSVYNLKIGRYSHPLKSSYGYHIMKVEDVRHSVFLNRDDFERKKQTLIDAVRNRRAIHKSAEYVSKILDGKSVRIKSVILEKLVQTNRNVIQDRDSENPLRAPAVTDGELNKISVMAELLMDETIVEFTGGSWTVAEFLHQVKVSPPLQRPVINQPQVLVKSIIDMVRDKLLLDEAYRQKLDDTGAVKKEVRRWRRKVLADVFNRRIMFTEYKKRDREKWEQRRELLNNIRERTKIQVDTALLFHDVDERELQKRIPRINIVVREAYNW